MVELDCCIWRAELLVGLVSVLVLVLVEEGGRGRGRMVVDWKVVVLDSVAPGAERFGVVEFVVGTLGSMLVPGSAWSTGAGDEDAEIPDCCMICAIVVVGAGEVLDRLVEGGIALYESVVLTWPCLCLLCDRSSITAGERWSVTCLLVCMGTYSVSIYLVLQPAWHIEVLNSNKRVSRDFAMLLEQGEK